MATKLDKLLEKEAQLKAQIQQVKAAERTLEKKRDTRRKILVGAAVMARVQNGEWPKADLQIMMDGFLTRPNERELFGLDVEKEDGAAAQVTTDTTQPVSQAAKGKSKEKGSETAASKPKTVEKTKSRRLSEPEIDLDKEFNI